MTKEEKIHRMRSIQDPQYAMGIAATEMMKTANAIKGIPGPMGPKPVKYVDYFTAADINGIVAHVQARVRNGKDSVVAGPTGRPGIKGEAGKDGISPDPEMIVRMVLGRVKMPKDGVSPSIKDIVSQVTKELKDTTLSGDVVTKTELVNFLKRGGFRGGGISSVVTDTTLTGNGTAASPLHVVSSGSFVGSQEKSTTVPNGVLQTFTFTHTPKVIFWNGMFQTLTDDYTVSGLTITFTGTNIPVTGDKIVNLYA